MFEDIIKSNKKEPEKKIADQILDDIINNEEDDDYDDYDCYPFPYNLAIDSITILVNIDSNGARIITK